MSTMLSFFKKIEKKDFETFNCQKWFMKFLGHIHVLFGFIV
jgi:hypothetical protein